MGVLVAIYDLKSIVECSFPLPISKFRVPAYSCSHPAPPQAIIVRSKGGARLRGRRDSTHLFVPVIKKHRDRQMLNAVSTGEVADVLL